MKAVQGASRSYYEVVMPKSMAGKKISLKVAGYIQKENQEWKVHLNQNIYDVLIEKYLWEAIKDLMLFMKFKNNYEQK